MEGKEKGFSGKVKPFVLLDGRTVLVGPLVRSDYDELNRWVKKQYMSNVREAVIGLDSQERMELLLAALDKAAMLTFQFGVGREILMGNAYGQARFAYQMIDRPPFSFDEFVSLLFPGDLLDEPGIKCVTDMINTAFDLPPVDLGGETEAGGEGEEKPVGEEGSVVEPEVAKVENGE